jgi:hypothetical protein
VISRRITFVLVAVCVGLTAWICLRDLDTSAPRPSERARAERDAGRALDYIVPSRVCAGRCSAQVLGKTAPRRWRVRLRTPHWERCFIVSVSKFGYKQQRGLSGLRAIRCD